MNAERNALIELYRITLEELRQHRTIYIQLFIGLGIIITILLATLGFLFGINSPVIKPEFITLVKIFIMLGAVLFVAFYFWTLYRYDRRLKTCRSVRQAIETRIVNHIPTFDELIIGKRLDKLDINWERIRFYIFIPLGAIILILFGLFLFLGIN